MDTCTRLTPLSTLKTLYLFLILFSCGFHAFSQKANLSPLQLAQEAFEQQRWEKALSMLDLWIQDNPADREAYWMRGQAHQYVNKLEEALGDFSSLLTLDPQFAEAYFERGRVRYLLGHYESAIEDFENFLKMPPGETNRVLYKVAPGSNGVSEVTTLQTASAEQAYYHLGLCSIELGEYDFAILYLDEALSLNPEEADFYTEKGRALARLGDNVPAMEAFELALELNPNHLPAKEGLALVKTGGDEVLLSQLDQVVAEGSGNSQTYKQRGFYRMSHGQDDGAIEDFGLAISLDPEDSESYFYRGKTYSRQKKWKDAEADYSAAISLDPENPEYLLSRGQSRYVSGQLEEALADFTQTIALDPDFASGYYHRGITYQRMNRKSEACSELQKAIDLGMEAAVGVWEKVCKQD